jgi:hypothetical protein
VGDVWRDKDKRSMGGHRTVRVVDVKLKHEGDPDTVFYRDAHGIINTIYRSRYDRFQRAFDFVESARDVKPHE